jgi:hypothetical protein
MATDRFTKVVLTVLAIGVWALAIAYSGTPTVLANAANEVTPGTSSLEPVSNEPAVEAAPAATYPLRWYISLVHHEVASGSVDCKTVVMVVNLHNSSVNAEIEFYDDTGSVLASRSDTIAAGATYYVGTDQLTGPGEYPQTGDHLIPGHGRVYASHPNIIALNFIECPTGAVSVTSYPVGATLDYFQASLPAAGGIPLPAEIVERPQPR